MFKAQFPDSSMHKLHKLKYILENTFTWQLQIYNNYTDNLRFSPSSFSHTHTHTHTVLYFVIIVQRILYSTIKSILRFKVRLLWRSSWQLSDHLGLPTQKILDETLRNGKEFDEWKISKLSACTYFVRSVCNSTSFEITFIRTLSSIETIDDSRVPPFSRYFPVA